MGPQEITAEELERAREEAWQPIAQLHSGSVSVNPIWAKSLFMAGFNAGSTYAHARNVGLLKSAPMFEVKFTPHPDQPPRPLAG